MRKYIIVLLLSLTSVIFCAGDDRYMYIGVVDNIGLTYDFSSEPYGNVTFIAWITSRPTEIINQNSAGCGYEDFDCSVSAVVLNAGSFPTPWAPGDELCIYMRDELIGCSAWYSMEMSNSYEYILVGLDAWFGSGVSTDPPYDPISLCTPEPNEVELDRALIDVVDVNGEKFDFSAVPYDNVTFECWITGEEEGIIDQDSQRSEYLNYESGSYLVINTNDFPTHWVKGDTLNVLIKQHFPGLGYYYGTKQYEFMYTTSYNYYDYINFGTEGDPVAADVWVDDTGIGDVNVPSATTLHQNYPNPFNPVTEISFSLPKEERVTLSVFNSDGQLVKELVNGKVSAGYHSVNFTASDLNSGIYFYTLETGNTKLTKKMLFVK